MTYQPRLQPALLFFCLLLISGTTVFAQDDPAPETPAEAPVEAGATAAGEGDYLKGKALWKANICQSCHANSMKDDMTGPALGGVEARWAAYPREDLYDWIRNSQLLVSRGHPRAKEVSEKYPGVMSNFPDLSDGEIEDLLSYINEEYEGRP